MVTALSIDASRWADERARVRAEFSEAAVVDRPPRRGLTTIQLTLAPVPPAGELQAVLADLDAGRLVRVGQDGRVRHSPSCPDGLPGHPARLPRIQLIDQHYVVEVEYPAMPWSDAGPIHPKVRIIDPPITIDRLGGHPHLSYNPNNGDSWACPLSPHNTTWSWRPGATLEYIDQVAIWLLQTQVWIATGGRALPSLGVWVGEAESHEPSGVLSSVRLDGPCRCGSGRTYETCHFRPDLAEAVDWPSRKANR